MSDSATHPKIIALREIISKLSEQVDEYAKLYKESRTMSKDDPARKELAERLTKNMLCMMAQAHLVQCRFYYTLAASFGEAEVMNRLGEAVMKAHENEEHETNKLHEILKGHQPWQM